MTRESVTTMVAPFSLLSPSSDVASTLDVAVLLDVAGLDCTRNGVKGAAHSPNSKAA